MPDVDSTIETFFKLVLGRNNGYLCLAFLDPVTRKFKEEFFEYPDQLPQIVTRSSGKALTDNVYFCPNLFDAKKRNKENVICTPNAWADLDRCAPTHLLIKPTAVLQSSPARWQAFWAFDENPEPQVAEELSRRIAYFHKEQGADQSGWDLTQLLRVPNTFNYKYDSRPEVELFVAEKRFYRPEDFKPYPDLKHFKIEEDNDLVLPQHVSTLRGADILAGEDRDLPQKLLALFQDEPEDSEWSDKLWFLEMIAFEQGFSREAVFVIARDSKCNKYARDGRPESDLWKEVLRAEEQFRIKREGDTFDDVIQDCQILSQSENRIVMGLENSIVEDYIEWASSLTDAAPQYHQAGIFVILSALLSGSVTLPTSYGIIIPNLWFMILADTTLTRKSTSMDVAMDILEDLESDSVLATDGSLEGMLTGLAMRPKKPSVFLRDEFSGLIEAILKKDYLAGMAEMFTKLYDGRPMKRLLKKEVVEVKDPRLIIFGGGIKDKITGLLTHEHISSGFIPRFLFITAESDITRVRPLGPPTTANIEHRSRMLERLREIFNHYNRTTLLQIGDTGQGLEVKQDMNAYLTDEAWKRTSELELQLLKMGTNSYNPSLMTPVYDRLTKSILKAAVLIAASRQFNDTVVVELEDLLRAIKFGEDWLSYAEEVINAIGSSDEERMINKIFDYIQNGTSQGGVNRGKIMRVFKLTNRRANEIFQTLDQRNLISKVQGEGSVTYVATGSTITF